jgi:hypothetical protein
MAAASTMSLALSEAFDSAFYKAFVQNAYESPGRLEPVRRLPGPVRIYLRTADDTGRAIDAVTLNSTERAIVASVGIWSGDQFGVSEVARGTGTREKVAGWLTIKWSSVANANSCGRSTVGVDGGYIEFNDLSDCSCGMPSRIYPRLVRHELGHAMGYYHTDRVSDVMYGRAITPDGCDLQPSERERRYAKYLYSQSEAQ